MRYHPDKKTDGSEEFQRVHEAYQSLSNREDRAKIDFRVEKQKKNEEASGKVKEFREELLKKERGFQGFFPKKKRTYQREVSSTPEEVYTGVKVVWKANSLFTEEILEKIFSEYGTILKILSSPTKAYVLFVSTMASVMFT